MTLLLPPQNTLSKMRSERELKTKKQVRERASTLGLCATYGTCVRTVTYLKVPNTSQIGGRICEKRTGRRSTRLTG